METLILKCIADPKNEAGERIFNFTLGDEYVFEKSYDPEGWEVEDDDGSTEVFFDPYCVFQKISDPKNPPCMYHSRPDNRGKCIKCGETIV